MPDDAPRWRALAEEAKSVAAEMADPDAQHEMLLIAQFYEHLARFAEAQKKKSSS
jgi:phosphatidylethanolamine-binding protein (PEBP) family uncharacterized protein